MERLFTEYYGDAVSLSELCRKDGGMGKMRIERNFKKFFQIAARDPVFVLIDLDDCKCPPSLRRHWIHNVWKRDLPQKMFFCIADVEAESWLLADKKNFSGFIGIEEKDISTSSKTHKKDHLLNLIAKSKKKRRKRMFLKTKTETGRSEIRVGDSYNSELDKFVKGYWDPAEASKNSHSLRYLIKKIKAARQITQGTGNLLP